MWPRIERSTLELAFRIVMRVPGLFIIDYWWQHDRNKSSHSVNSSDMLNAAIINLVLFHGFLLLLLPLRYVAALYTHCVSFLLLLSAHMISLYYVQLETVHATLDSYFYIRQLILFVLLLTISLIASFLLYGPAKPHPLVLTFYSLPVVARVLSFPVRSLEMVHNFSATMIALSLLRYIYFQLPSVVKCVKEAYADAVLLTEANGWVALFVTLWNKLFIPNHFLVFWLAQFLIKLSSNLWKFNLNQHRSAWGEEWYMVLLGTISTICGSPVSLVATAVTVSYVSYFVLRLTKIYLSGNFTMPTSDSPMYSGWTEGLTLILFAIQTGLIEMKMPARMAVMTIILFIDLSTLLQSMLDITEPAILGLSASRSRNIWRHLRAFSVCAFLFGFPLFLTYSLSQVFALDFWMIVLLSSCILTSFQVLDLLVVHFLFLYDSYRSEPWESLDEVVYYTRAVTKVFEFLVAVFVVGVGLFESPMGKWNWANSSIILIHCYFNVWQRLQAGWRSFLLRREAVKKTLSLPSASSDQLMTKNDVCAICFAYMREACITPCNHFFHRTCLRKWLYIQDSCPLCHSAITVISKDDITEKNVSTSNGE